MRDILGRIGAPPVLDLEEILHPGVWGFTRHWDFDCGASLDGWDSSGTGTVVTLGTDIDDQHPGEVALSTGTTSTGYSTLNRGTARLIAGSNLFLSFDALVKTPILSDGTNSFQVRVGFGDASAGGDNTDGFYWESTAGASPTWHYKTAAAGTRTDTASGVSMGTGWHRLSAIAGPIGGTLKVSFWLDNVLMGTQVTTNIPTGANQFGALNSITKLAGTSNRATYLDYYTLRARILTPSSPRIAGAAA